MFLEDFAKKRHSVRNYTNEKINEEEIAAIAEASLRAPSALNRKPVDLVIITDPSELKRLATFKTSGAQMIAEAACAFVILSDKEKAPTTFLQDGSLAAGYLQLQAHDLGLGCVWSDAYGARHESGTAAEEVLREWYDIPERYAAICVIPVGHPEEESTSKDSFDWQGQVHYGKFQT